MFQHVLVPVDFSERNSQALKIAVEMAQMSHGRVSLLHVIKLISGGTYEEFADFYQKLERDAQEKMADLTAVYSASDVPINTYITVGHRIQEIINFAAEQQVGVIVMNSHKVNLQNPDEDWGTISYKVGVLAQCPVLLVK